MRDAFATGTAGKSGALERVEILALAAVLAVTALRVLVLFLSDLELYGDEAQYWTYAEEPAFGYYSKPPLIAWIIGLATWLFGNTEAAVRLASPILHGLTALAIWRIGRAMFDARVGAWAALAYVTLPAASLSSLLVSTDVPLLLCWAIALLAFWRLLGGGGWGWAILLGLAFGLGLLAKYAMAYFALGLVVFAALDREGRRRVLDWKLLGALVLGLAVWSPNLLWNLGHGGATLVHVTESGNLSNTSFQPLRGLEFLLGQAAVVGPILLVALAVRIARLGADPPDRRERLLLSLSLPVLVLMSVQAAIAGANANWAATAYVAGVLLITAWLLGIGRRAWLGASLALHGVVLLLLLGVVATNTLGDLPYSAAAYSRVNGWRDFAAGVDAEVARERPAVVLLDHRFELAEYWFYRREEGPELAMWVSPPAISNHYEMERAFGHEAEEPVLYVTRRRDPDDILRNFEDVTPLSTLVVETAPGRERRYGFFLLRDFVPK